MPLQIVRNDITKMEVDAIVNASDNKLSGGGGIDLAIHRAAGKELMAECRSLGGVGTGDALITGAYALPCKYVIHTAGPIWQGGDKGEKELLESCYISSLAIAAERGCTSVAFPLISAGVFGYPRDKAIRVAVNTIGEFLADHDMMVYLVIFDKDSFTISEKLYTGIKEYIDDNYVNEHTDAYFERRRVSRTAAGFFRNNKSLRETSQRFDGAAFEDSALSMDDLGHAIAGLDESFTEMLLRKIDESGMTDTQCYKKANIDRKLFSKIRSDANYRPSKQTAIAFAIALELPLDEASDLLKKAGFALSHSNKFDVIIEYFIKNGVYDIMTINEALFAFDQVLLGA